MANTQKHNEARNTGVPLKAEAGLPESFTEEVKDIYFTEKSLKKLLLLLQKSANNAALIDVILEHAELSNSHLSKLEEVFQLSGLKPQLRKDDLIDKLTKEAGILIEDTEEAWIRDEGIMRIFTKITDLQIGAYEDLEASASQLGLTKIAAVFDTIIEEKIRSQENIAGITDNESNYLPED